MKQYVKAIIAVLGGVSAWGITAAADNAITAVEVYGLLGVLATALGVYAFPNEPAEADERGSVSLSEILLVVVVVILVLWAVGEVPR